MKKTAIPALIAASSVLLLFAAACDKGEDPAQDAPRVITLLSPKGGAGVQYAVNDTVRISWTVHNDNPDSALFSNVAIVGSTDGGVSFSVPISGSNPVPVDTPVWNGSYLWTIGSGCVSSQFVLRLYDYTYNSQSFDMSAPFIVVP